MYKHRPTTNHDHTQLLDLLLSAAIFVVDEAPSPPHVVFVTDGASSPLHVVGTTKVNWVLILDENHGVTNQHNGQKVVSKRGAKVGLDSLKWVLILDEL